MDLSDQFTCTITLAQAANTKSLAYRTSYLPGYDPENELCQENEKTMTMKQMKQADNWNTYQKNTWYMTHLNHLERDDCPVGVQGEFRTPGLAETKVHLTESGKWKSFVLTQTQNNGNSQSLEENFAKTLLDDEDFYATNPSEELIGSGGDATGRRSFRPHSSSPSKTSTINGMRSMSGTRSQESINNRNSGNRTMATTQTPPINPRTMFLPKTQKAIFGETKQPTQLFPSTASPSPSLPSRTTTAGAEGYSSSLRPHTSHAATPNTVRWTDQQNDELEQSRPLSATGTQLSSRQPPGHHPEPRLMSSQALSRRHMGVSIHPPHSNNSSSGNGNGEESYHSKLLTLKNSNQLNHRSVDLSNGNGFTSGGFTSGSFSKSVTHPQSGYDRGLKGTLLIDDWRQNELMKSDGKICYHPLSYDVLETLTYGPPDPNNKHSHDQIFPPLPTSRATLVHKIFSCLLSASASTSSPSSRSPSAKTITIPLFLQFYNPSAHPAVLSHRVTTEQVLQGIIFDMLGEDCYEEYGHYSLVPPLSPSSLISLTHFESHYRAVSSVIFSDEYFEKLLRDTWSCFQEELPRGRGRGQYAKRVDTADFESVMRSSRNGNANARGKKK